MSDGIQLRQITKKDEDLPGSPTYSNPSFGHTDISAPNGKSAVVSLENIDPEVDYKTKKKNRKPEDEDIHEDCRFEEIPPPDGLPLKIHSLVSAVEDFTVDNYKYIMWTIIGALLILYIVYFSFAMRYAVKYDLMKTEEATRLLWVTCVVVGCILLGVLWRYIGGPVKKCLAPCLETWEEKGIGRALLWTLLVLIYVGVLVFIFVDVFHLSDQPYNMVSLGGLACMILLCFIFSYSPAHVNWRAVAWGIGMQFVLALIILRWTWGYNAFQWLGDRVAEFLAHADAGAEFVFGAVFREHFFAFAVLPVVVYFSTFISILYYLGVMQWVIQKVSWLLQNLMGTTAGESLNAAGNIFIGQSEAPLLIKPLVKDMTKSEIHAVMTGGFATIAGSVLAAYILFGVPANHLISASVMSAPAALAISKLFYPETQVSKTKAEDVKSMAASPERNLIEAASSGASQSIKLVANIAVNLIAFIALLQLLNSTLTWFGHRIGWYDEPLTFEMICSYVFYPLAVVMGVDLKNCRIVGELIGVKTFLNEFVAYDRLGVFIKNKQMLAAHLGVNGTYSVLSNSSILLFDYYDPQQKMTFNETLLPRGLLTERSEVISTYALCGFSNIGSMGIMLGALGAMAPTRKSDMSTVVFRAMIAGNVACFMTACVAGIFYQPSGTVVHSYNWDQVLSVV